MLNLKEATAVTNLQRNPDATLTFILCDLIYAIANLPPEHC